MLKETQEIFSVDILHEAIMRFGGTKEKCKDLGGFEAFVYELEIDNKFYIMKITHTIRRSVNFILGELEFVNYLEEHSVPTSKAVLSIQNKYVETIDAPNGGQFLVYMFVKAEGYLTKFEDWSDDFISSWGQTAGLINRLAKEFTPSSLERTRQHWHADNAFNFSKYIPGSKSTTVENCKKIIDGVKTIPIDKNSYGLVHGDLHQGNFFNNNGIITPFDFDDCGYNYFVNDIAMPLYYALPESYHIRDYGIPQEEFGENFLYNFLIGYRKENQVEKEWILKIPNFLKIRSIILYVILSQVWVGDTLNNNRASIIERLRTHIDGEIKFLDIDYRKFV